MDHFWYSEKMAAMMLEDGDMPNRCIIEIEAEAVEIEYTHCCSYFLAAGGSKWGDEVYLGIGRISHVGAKRSMYFRDSQ